MTAASVTEKITKFIRPHLSDKAIILGPVASPIPRINNRYRYQCLIKYKQQIEELKKFDEKFEIVHNIVTEALKEDLEKFNDRKRSSEIKN